MTQAKILILGAGKIGATVAAFLADTGDYAVTISDAREDAFKNVADLDVQTQVIDVTNEAELAQAASQHEYILSALPFHLTKEVAKAAKNAEAHYFDLTEDVAISEFVRDLAKDAKSTFVPQSGLAPGFISIAGYHLAQKFDEIDELKLRVGALPKYPSNAFKYNLTWSTDGLVNEYIHPCNALVDGKMVQIPALDGRENFALDGVDYEAFNTSGGLGTICETLNGKAQNVTYKSIRYPGHLDVVKFLLRDLKLNQNPQMLVQILENAIPATTQDTVLVWVSAQGKQNGRLMQETYVSKVYAQEVAGRMCSAIQVTTAGAVCAVIDMVREGAISKHGFVKQEDIDFHAFTANRFGKFYKHGEVV